MSYKSWGNYREQTVKQSREHKNELILRSGDIKMPFKKKEAISLIIAILEMIE